MLDGAEQAAAMRDVRERFHAALADHERKQHGGKRCTANVLSALAYLAHTLGVRHAPEAGYLGFFADRLAEYNEQCPDGVGCGHERGHDAESVEKVAGYATPVPGRRASDAEVPLRFPERAETVRNAPPVLPGDDAPPCPPPPPPPEPPRAA